MDSIRVLIKLTLLLSSLNIHVLSRQSLRGKENYRQIEKQILDDILGKGYDKRIRPSGRNYTVAGDGPTLIMVNSMIRSISKIDDYKMVSKGRECITGHAGYRHAFFAE
ncbi:uncharacterized protein LOC111702130, partial [Eurytemora carolleeae]|uniref:uncharacterized protein LOC111702130 n=1 Tax=Eurytemora carolleeae TaxID=1294199 RepID=UPI000C7811C7